VTCLYRQNSLRGRIHHMRRKEESYNVRQSAELLDLQKNILRIGFDSSTDFHVIFKHAFRKKLSCTILGEEQKNFSIAQEKYCALQPLSLPATDSL